MDRGTVDRKRAVVTAVQVSLLRAIASRRAPELWERISAAKISPADAERVVETLADEFTANLDEDWEPTEYGRAVNAVLSRFNAARLADGSGN